MLSTQAPVATASLPISVPANPAALRPLHTLSCIVPCYNEAENLEQLLPLLQAQLACLAEQWEIILVDDFSEKPFLGKPLEEFFKKANIDHIVRVVRTK